MRNMQLDNKYGSDMCYSEPPLGWVLLDFSIHRRAGVVQVRRIRIRQLHELAHKVRAGEEGGEKQEQGKTDESGREKGRQAKSGGDERGREGGREAGLCGVGLTCDQEDTLSFSSRFVLAAEKCHSALSSSTSSKTQQVLSQFSLGSEQVMVHTYTRVLSIFRANQRQKWHTHENLRATRVCALAAILKLLKHQTSL